MPERGEEPPRRGRGSARRRAGRAIGRSDALRCARLWGRACFIGLGPPATLDVSRDIINKQLTVHGSRTFSTVGLEECAASSSSGASRSIG